MKVADVAVSCARVEQIDNPLFGDELYVFLLAGEEQPPGPTPTCSA